MTNLVELLASDAFFKRIETAMKNLWFPAVLGTFVYAFLDRLFSQRIDEISDLPALLSSLTDIRTAYSAFLILFLSSIYCEMVFASGKYDLLLWIRDLAKTGTMMVTFAALGLVGSTASPVLHAPFPRVVYPLLTLLFLLPILGRLRDNAVAKEKERRNLTGLSLFAAGACAGSWLLNGIRADWSLIVAWANLALLFLLWLLYAGIIAERASRQPVPT